MRLSVEENDPGYGPIALSGSSLIWLDGVPQKHCLTADEESGYIKRCKLGPDGSVVFDGEQFLIEEVHGSVRIGVRNDRA